MSCLIIREKNFRIINIDNIPSDIKTYVEVFGGAFWVYINGDIHEKPKLKEVIYNDFNRYMANLFECCRTPKEFNEYMIDLLAQNEKLFYKFKKDIFKNKDKYNIIIGSSNLTQDALSTNYEINIKLTANKDSKIVNETINNFNL